jgi:hypothetical protein
MRRKKFAGVGLPRRPAGGSGCLKQTWDLKRKAPYFLLRAAIVSSASRVSAGKW